MTNPQPFSLFNQVLLFVCSALIVAFGQPAWLSWSGLIASVAGFAIFWRLLLAYPKPSHRFYLASLWFSLVQLVQLSWFVSHPYWYIYLVYFILALGMGIQFGLLGLLIKPEKFSQKNLLKSLPYFLPIAAVWTILEWSRLFLMSGFSWNPIGISMAGNLYALQAASIMGVLGLSFWVIIVNLFALRAWVQKNLSSIAVWLIALFLPYAYGALHIAYFSATESFPHLTTMLVQTAFSPEESQDSSAKKNIFAHVTEEWKKILETTKKHDGKDIHLIVLPEFVVPFGTYSDVFSLLDVQKTFYEVFGEKSLKTLPALTYPFYSFQKPAQGLQLQVNNAYWAQALANYFQADILVGLEDAEDVPHGKREYYSSAIFIHPQINNDDFFAERYAKRVLVPMGEYIPFESCKKLAEKYGVFSSFTCGKEAVVMNSHGIAFSPSICYEETFSDIMKDGKQQGAQLFVNLTSDVWYPNSKLPLQHLEHARLRTVENGIPLIRACNTGITAAIDSFGRNIAVLGGNEPEKFEWVADSLLVDVPIHTYPTLYSRFGDFLIIGMSFLFLILGFNKLI